MAQEGDFLNDLIWAEGEDGTLICEGKTKDGVWGELCIRRVVRARTLLGRELFSYEVLASVAALDVDLDAVKEMMQAFFDLHPKAADALRTLWEEYESFSENRLLGRRPDDP